MSKYFPKSSSYFCRIYCYMGRWKYLWKPNLPEKSPKIFCKQINPAQGPWTHPAKITADIGEIFWCLALDPNLKWTWGTTASIILLFWTDILVILAIYSQNVWNASWWATFFNRCFKMNLFEQMSGIYIHFLGACFILLTHPSLSRQHYTQATSCYVTI